MSLGVCFYFPHCSLPPPFSCSLPLSLSLPHPRLLSLPRSPSPTPYSLAYSRYLFLSLPPLSLSLSRPPLFLTLLRNLKLFFLYK